MQRHLWMHGALIAVVLGVFGLSALGVAIPSALFLLVLLACPVMMMTMMGGMDHGSHGGHGGQQGGADHTRSPHDHESMR